MSIANEIIEDLSGLLSDVAGASDDAFTLSSISSFKGLEAEIVIIVDTPDSLETGWNESIMAVGITRARTKCFVVVSKSFVQWRSNRINTQTERAMI